MKRKILIVDDEPDILEVLSDYLEERGYSVLTAPDGQIALELMEVENFDLIISDINMPKMKGFDLLQKARDQFPNTKRILITAYALNEYMQMAKDYDIGNIITKTSPFNFEEVGLVVDRLISEEVFGLDKYLKKESQIQQKWVRDSDEIDSVIEEVNVFLKGVDKKTNYNRILRELVVNAFYYGARNEKGDRKAEWQIDVKLSPEQFILVSYGYDSEKVGAAVSDQCGHLHKKDVLFWLERNITRNNEGLSKGLFDEHGKGLFIAREMIDRFIVNTKTNVKTEIVVLNYLNSFYKGYKPLYINEF